MELTDGVWVYQFVFCKFWSFNNLRNILVFTLLTGKTQILFGKSLTSNNCTCKCIGGSCGQIFGRSPCSHRSWQLRSVSRWLGHRRLHSTGWAPTSRPHPSVRTSAALHLLSQNIQHSVLFYTRSSVNPCLQAFH